MINITRSQVAPSSQGIEGSTLTMTVDINIRFGFGVKWLRNGTQVSHSPGRFLIQQSFIDVMKCSLDILELKLRDQGKNLRTLMFNGCLELPKLFLTLKLFAACFKIKSLLRRLFHKLDMGWFIFRGIKGYCKLYYFHLILFYCLRQDFVGFFCGNDFILTYIAKFAETKLQLQY